MKRLAWLRNSLLGALAWLPLAATANPTPAWELAIRGAPTSRGSVHALTFANDELLVAGERLGDDNGFIAAVSAVDGTRRYSHDVLPQHDAVFTTAIVPRATGGGYYLAGNRYADDYEGFLSRYGADGRRAWTVDVGYDYFVQAAEISPDRVVVAVSRYNTSGSTIGARLLLIDAASGALVLQRDLDWRIRGDGLSTLAGSIYVRTYTANIGERLERFDGDTLALQWRYVAESMHLLTANPVVAAPGVLAVAASKPGVNPGSSAPLILALDVATGQQRWSVQSNYVASYLDGGFARQGDRVVLAAQYDDGVVLLTVDANTGVRQSDIQVPGDPRALAVDAERTYLALEDTNDQISVQAFAPGSATPTWSQPLGQQRVVQLAAANGRVAVAYDTYVATRELGMSLFASDTGSAVPVAALDANPAFGSAINDAAGNVYVAATSLEDDAAVLLVRSFDRLGALRWSRRLPFFDSYPPTDVLQPAGIVLAPGGTVLAWGSANNVPADGSQLAHIGSSQLNALDIGTGATRWSRQLYGEQPWSDLPAILDVASTFDSIYVQTSMAHDVEPGFTVYGLQLQRLSLADGSVAWTRNENGGNSIAIPYPMLPVQDVGVIVSGGRVADGPGGLALYRQSDGSVAWTRATLGPLRENARFGRLSGGDVVVAHTATSGGNRDVGVERFDSGTGAIRWQLSFGANNGLTDDPRGLLVLPGDEIYVAGRYGNSLATSKAFVARVDPAGTEAWQATMNGGVGGHTGSQLGLTPAGELSFVIRHVREALDSACSVCQSHAVRIDRTSGQVYGWHHLGSEVDGGNQVGTALVRLVGNDAGDVTLYSQAYREGDRTLRVAGLAWPALEPGSATVAITSGPGIDPVGSRGRARVEIAITHDVAHEVAGIVMQTALPTGYNVFDTGCTIDGGGDCGVAVNDGAIQRTLTLAPGATARISAMAEFPAGSSASASLSAIVQMPFAYGTTNPAGARATVTVRPATLLSNGFE